MFSLCTCKTDTGEQSETAQPTTSSEKAPADTSSGNENFDIPEYQGEPSVEINNGEPTFRNSLKKEDSFEEYGDLDKRGRCTTALASLSVDTQPGTDEEREDISSVRPSGWMSGQGWERCHLIGWQLSGQNANARNLVTGTHYMNVSGMLPYENKFYWYI